MWVQHFKKKEEFLLENKYNAIRLDENDNVAVALRNIRTGEAVMIHGLDEEIEVKKGIPYGHKIALKDIGAGEKVLKYGECMGVTTEEIPKGHHVHVSNVRGLNDKERAAVIGEMRKV